MASQWYYKDSENEVGPVVFADLVQLIRDGSLIESDFVRRSDSNEWQHAEDVVGLFHMAHRQPVQEQPVSAEAATVQDAAAATDGQPDIVWSAQARPSLWVRILNRLLGRKPALQPDPAALAGYTVEKLSETGVDADSVMEPVGASATTAQFGEAGTGDAGTGLAEFPNEPAEAEHDEAAVHREWSQTVHAALDKMNQRQHVRSPQYVRHTPASPGRTAQPAPRATGLFAWLSHLLSCLFTRKSGHSETVAKEQAKPTLSPPLATTPSMPADLNQMEGGLAGVLQQAPAADSTTDSDTSWQPTLDSDGDSDLPATAVTGGREDEEIIDTHDEKEWSATVAAALEKVDSRTKRQKQEDAADTRRVSVMTWLLFPIHLLLILPRFLLRVFQRIIDLIFDTRFAHLFVGWLSRRGIQPSPGVARVMRHTIRIVPAIVAANVVFFGVSQWAQREAMRFPVRGDQPIVYRLPIAGKCSQAEYWFLLIDAMLLAAGIVYAIAYYLETHAEDS